MTASMPWLNRLPRGDGHPVLVLPGFGASDRSTGPLRRLLRRLGYRTYSWRLGRNIGPTPEIVQGLVERLERVRRSNDAAVSVIGWSLGGIYARRMARQFPESVRQVITMGSPIRMVEGDRSAASGSWDAVRHLHDPDVVAQARREAHPPPQPVPTTAIYTRTDGIVWWKTCLVVPGPTSENVEVYGSHTGLGFNTSAVYVVADRLAQPASEWRPFRAPLWLRPAFPAPAAP